MFSHWKNRFMGGLKPKPLNPCSASSDGSRNSPAESASSDSAYSDKDANGAQNGSSNGSIFPQLPASKVTKEDFEVLDSLGQGKFGKVVLVKKSDVEKLYAMKVVDKASVLDRGRVKDLFSERSVLKRAKHPFIVKLDYTFQSEHKLFFVMEYLEGGDLAGYLNSLENKRMSESQARFYAGEILLALQYLHDNGVIYRDLKPENILLDENGHACLSDFGLSKDFEGDPLAVTDLRCQSFVGSPYYVAPEILRHQKYGQSVDWWSYGVLLYRMLCGTVPFSGRNIRQVFDSIMYCKPDFTHYPWIAVEAKQLILDLLKKDEKARSTGSRVKSHVFFGNYDWDSLFDKQLSSPDYVPAKAHFSAPQSVPPRPNASAGVAVPVSVAAANQVDDVVHISPPILMGSQQQKLFEGFTYISQHLMLERLRSGDALDKNSDGTVPPAAAPAVGPDGCLITATGSTNDIASQGQSGPSSPVSNSGDFCEMYESMAHDPYPYESSSDPLPATTSAQSTPTLSANENGVFRRPSRCNGEKVSPSAAAGPTYGSPGTILSSPGSTVITAVSTPTTGLSPAPLLPAALSTSPGILAPPATSVSSLLAVTSPLMPPECATSACGSSEQPTLSIPRSTTSTSRLSSSSLNSSASEDTMGTGAPLTPQYNLEAGAVKAKSPSVLQLCSPSRCSQSSLNSGGSNSQSSGGDSSGGCLSTVASSQQLTPNSNGSKNISFVSSSSPQKLGSAATPSTTSATAHKRGSGYQFTACVAPWPSTV